MIPGCLKTGWISADRLVREKDFKIGFKVTVGCGLFLFGKQQFPIASEVEGGGGYGTGGSAI